MRRRRSSGRGEIVPNLAVAELIAGEGHLFSADAERRVYDRIAEFLALGKP